MWEQKINPMQETNDQIHPGGAITARHWDTLRMSVGSYMEDHQTSTTIIRDGSLMADNRKMFKDMQISPTTIPQMMRMRP